MNPVNEGTAREVIERAWSEARNHGDGPGYATGRILAALSDAGLIVIARETLQGASGLLSLACPGRGLEPIEYDRRIGVVMSEIADALGETP